MTGLTRRTEHPLAHLDPELIKSAQSFARDSKSDRTRTAYRTDWAIFEVWCESKKLSCYPASPETVALFLTDMAKKGRKVSTLRRYVVSISQGHKAQGIQEPPTKSHAVKEVLKGIRNQLGVRPNKKTAMTVDILWLMVKGIPRTRSGLRDRALLLLGFAGCFRRSEIVSLMAEDVEFNTDGMTVLLRSSKTDQERAGLLKGIKYGGRSETCPVRALKAWMDVSGIRSGRLFELSDRSVARIVKRHALRIGLDPHSYGGHSLRRGFATEAARKGKSRRSIRKQGGWKEGSSVLEGYIDDGQIFEDNASDGIGL